jgi:hypothetical protein
MFSLKLIWAIDFPAAATILHEFANSAMSDHSTPGIARCLITFQNGRTNRLARADQNQNTRAMTGISLSFSNFRRADRCNETEMGATQGRIIDCSGSRHVIGFVLRLEGYGLAASRYSAEFGDCGFPEKL